MLELISIGGGATDQLDLSTLPFPFIQLAKQELEMLLQGSQKAWKLSDEFQQAMEELDVTHIAGVQDIQKHVKEIMTYIVDHPDSDIIITHGSGPQTGTIDDQREFFGLDDDTSIGVGTLMIQLLMGAVLQKCLQAELPNNDKHIVMQPMAVAVENPEHLAPIKNIGKAGKKVISPILIHILTNVSLSQNTVLITAGGGAVPIYDRTIVDGVVDKDYTSKLLAEKMKASKIITLTKSLGVMSYDKILAHFGVADTCEKYASIEDMFQAICAANDGYDIEKVREEIRSFSHSAPEKMYYENLTVKEAKRLLPVLQKFGGGSMYPKVQAAVDFVEESEDKDAAVVITNADNLNKRNGWRTTITK